MRVADDRAGRPALAFAPAFRAARGKLWALIVGVAVGSVFLASARPPVTAPSPLRPVLPYGLGLLSIFAGIVSLWSP